MVKNKKNTIKKGLKLNRFDKRLEHISASVISKIGQIDELKGRWITGAQLSPQVLGRLKRSVLITSTGASTRIEGAKLSDEDVEKMMRGISIQKFTDRDKQEVKGYYQLLENVFNSWKTLRFNEGTVKHFHSELLKYVDKDQRHRGDYKKQENKVHMVNEAGESLGVLFDTTAAYLTPKEMQELIEWTNIALKEKKYHVLLIVANFLVEFLKIHPFQDGNGRLSRVLTNLLLLKEGYEYMPYVSHEKLVEDNKPEYYIALRKSQKTISSKKPSSANQPAGEAGASAGREDIAPWFEFFFTILIGQAKMAEELLSKESIEKLLSEKQLAVWQYLQDVEEASTGDLVKKTKIPRATVKQALDRLLQFKKIERIGLGRSARYRKTT
ncbi:Fic family protein [Candidatus Falkowbacteria bacterium]|nr:Fic family protein [Candidatus Falkowbacteria bacterium]